MRHIGQPAPTRPEYRLASGTRTVICGGRAPLVGEQLAMAEGFAQQIDEQVNRHSGSKPAVG